MDTEGTTKNAALRTLLHRVPRSISRAVEKFFYKLGYEIAKHPAKWILACVLLVLACLLGLIRFRQEKNPLRLWIPPDSDFVRDTEWLMSKFGEGQRIETMIMTGEDVLEPKALLELNEITKRLLSVKTASQPPSSWTDVCFKVPIISGVISREKRDVGTDDDFFEQAPGARMNASAPYEPVINVPSDVYCSIVESLPRGCLFQSILDLWEYDSELIANQTKGGILERLNAVKMSPTLGHAMVFTELLGGVKTDELGRVVSASAVNTLWYVHVNFTNLKMNETGNESGTADWVTAEVLDWEAALLRELDASSRDLASRNPIGTSGKSLTIWYQAGRSWGDISAETMLQDFGKILLGILVMSVYVQIILSRLNWVEWRFCLTSVGLVCVAGAFLVAVGLCSLCGIPYGPVHASLPFMLMGLGVDDIFVIMASWDQTSSLEANRSRPLTERIAMMLSHAGAAIFVTSFTDVVAFAIGASTILPSLQSFCIYAAVGVMVTFVLQVTFFVAFFTLDVERSEAKRNGAFPCVIHPSHVETYHDPRQSVSSRFLDVVYSRIVLSLPGKLTVILMTLGLTSFGVLGYSRLEQWFDPEWFIPKDTYLSDFLRVKTEHFPKRGHPASIFIGEVEYSEELPRIVSLVGALKNMNSTVDKVEAWPQEFAQFVSINYNKDVTSGKMESDDFYNYLSKFLFSRSGGRYQSKFRFATNLTCGKVAPRILVSVIDFSFVTFTGPDQWIPAMDGVKALARDSRINGLVFVWSHIFASWVTDKVIADEVNRNLILALVCVMATTAVLIAEPQTCFWILLCVLLTLVDVCGFMYYWGLTIDIVSCIGLELAVGLSVDYAAHVAHAFLNAPASDEGENRTVRTLTALRHIGAAVAYGAGSTLLAQSTMAFSEAYVFRAFFKIFFMVVIFGLWHGLVLLPVVLSSIGPRSLRPSTRRVVVTVDTKDAIELNVPLNQ